MSLTPVVWIRTWGAAHRTRNWSLRVDSTAAAAFIQTLRPARLPGREIGPDR